MIEPGWSLGWVFGSGVFSKEGEPVRVGLGYSGSNSVSKFVNKFVEV